MFEYVSFTEEEGKNTEKDLKVLALSTCGFCKRAIRFLKENDIAFKSIYLDKIDPDIKLRVKEEFQKAFDTKVLYPVLIIDEEEVITGFTSDKYRKALGIGED